MEFEIEFESLCSGEFESEREFGFEEERDVVWWILLILFPLLRLFVIVGEVIPSVSKFMKEHGE